MTQFGVYDDADGEIVEPTGTGGVAVGEDIVERLRAAHAPSGIFAEAADEIEQLRVEADKAKQADTGRYWMDIAGEREAENEQLRADKERLDWIEANAYRIEECERGWEVNQEPGSRSDTLHGAIDKAREGGTKGEE